MDSAAMTIPEGPINQDAIARLREEFAEVERARQAMKSELNDFTARAFEVAAGRLFWREHESMSALLALADAVNNSPVGFQWSDPDDDDDWIVTPGHDEADGMPVKRVRIVAMEGES